MAYRNFEPIIGTIINMAKGNEFDHSLVAADNSQKNHYNVLTKPHSPFYDPKRIL